MAAFLAVALLLTALPGTSWTLAPTDPNLVAGDYALVQVAHGAAAAVADKATSAGATDVAALDTLDMVTARLSFRAMRALQVDPRVAFLASDGTVVAAGRGDDRRGTRPGIDLITIGAPKAWRTSTGQGVIVAILDSGIAAHPDLEGSVVARVDFVGDGATSLDPGGHGTFVAGLIAAHGATFKGVAPDAKLVSIRVLDANGIGTLHSVLGGFDWLLRNRVAYGIKVANLSFGATQTTTYHRTLLAAVVESVWFSGVTVVAAAGNRGPLPGTVSMPGADPFVITVGSLDDEGTPDRSDDRQSEFSGRGPTLDGFSKPDVLAPGEHVLSLAVPGSGTGQNVDGAAYTRLTGTSASTAFASGAAALVLQSHGTYSPTQVKGALVAGALPVAGSQTLSLNADFALAVKPALVNVRVPPSSLLLRVLAQAGALAGTGLSWEGISWEAVSWEAVSWEAVSWEAVSWESVTWETLSWETVAWEGKP